ncbi:MAG TPA: peptidylprolyl isomerase [Methylovirgula sp.]|nr:peptidylprolyl isomerase [Methylovirgula sp.]
MSSKTLRAGGFGLAIALILSLPAGLTAEPAAAAVLATVNGQQITDNDLKIAAEDLGQSIPQQLQGKARDAYLLDYLIDSTLVAQKAASDKLDQDPDFAKRLAYFHDKILTEALLSKIANAAVTPQKLQETYDAAAKAQKPQTEIHARHILVDTEAQAEAALKRIKAGEDFAKVAKDVSKDGGADGGDLGWFTKDRMVPEFADAAFKLDVGQVSDPVKTQFGWHIIKVEGKRQTTFPPFDQVKGQVENFVVQQAQAQLIQQLHKDAKIERSPDAPTMQAPATPAPAPTPAPANAQAPADKK